MEFARARQFGWPNESQRRWRCRANNRRSRGNDDRFCGAERLRSRWAAPGTEFGLHVALEHFNMRRDGRFHVHAKFSSEIDGDDMWRFNGKPGASVRDRRRKSAAVERDADVESTSNCGGLQHQRGPTRQAYLHQPVVERVRASSPRCAERGALPSSRASSVSSTWARPEPRYSCQQMMPASKGSKTAAAVRHDGFHAKPIPEEARVFRAAFFKSAISEYRQVLVKGHAGTLQQDEKWIAALARASRILLHVSTRRLLTEFFKQFGL